MRARNRSRRNCLLFFYRFSSSSRCIVVIRDNFFVRVTRTAVHIVYTARIGGAPRNRVLARVYDHFSVVDHTNAAATSPWHASINIYIYYNVIILIN